MNNSLNGGSSNRIASQDDFVVIGLGIAGTLGLVYIREERFSKIN